MADPNASLDPLVRGHLKCWTRVHFDGEAPTPRSSHTATYVDPKTVIIFGGYCQGSNEDDFYVFNPDTFYSRPLGSMNQTDKTSRIGHAAVSLGFRSSHVYFFGGWDGKMYQQSGFLFNHERMMMTLESAKGRQVPEPCRDHTLTKVGDVMVLFGGWNVQSQYNHVWVLSESWQWAKQKTTGSTPIARRGHTAVAVGDKIYVFGGIYGYSKYLGDMLVLDTKTWEWSEPPTRGKAPHKRAWHSAVVVDKQILFFGGTSGRLQFHNDLFVFDTVTSRWFPVPVEGDTPSPRCSHTATLVGSRMIVFGGLTPSDRENKVSPVNDCYILETALDKEPKEVELSDDDYVEDEHLAGEGGAAGDLSGALSPRPGADGGAAAGYSASVPAHVVADAELEEMRQTRQHTPSMMADAIPAPPTTQMEDVEVDDLLEGDEKEDDAELQAAAAGPAEGEGDVSDSDGEEDDDVEMPAGSMATSYLAAVDEGADGGDYGSDLLEEESDESDDDGVPGAN